MTTPRLRHGVTGRRCCKDNVTPHPLIGVPCQFRLGTEDGWRPGYFVAWSVDTYQDHATPVAIVAVRTECQGALDAWLEFRLVGVDNVRVKADPSLAVDNLR